MTFCGNHNYIVKYKLHVIVIDKQMGQHQSTNNGQVSKNSRALSSTTAKDDLTIAQPCLENFYDLNEFPPEVGVQILSKLNATDLCLASCVWKDLSENETLWRK